MKKQILALGLIFTLSVAVTNCSRDEAEQITNKENNKPTRSDILSGNAAPTSNVGNVGDYYFDLSTKRLYGPKKVNGWKTFVTLENRNLNQIRIGDGAPSIFHGEPGDLYINKQDNTLLIKDAIPWRGFNGFPFGYPLELGEYKISGDKKILVQWNSIFTYTVDMNKYSDLQNINKILDNAFQGKNINYITLPKLLEEIGDYAFSGNHLTNVSIPNNVTSIGRGAFSGNQLTSVTIPNSITKINDYTFSDNELTSVSIPNNITSIGNNAFSRNKLSSVNIPNSITSIGDNAFSGNELTSVNIPNNIKSIGYGTFSSNHLTNVNIPNNVTSIGEQAFYDNLLTSITIPNSVTSIGRNAFSNNQLTSITIPSSVTSIGSGAFSNNLLTSITIPSNVTSIGSDAFLGNSLIRITIHAITPPYIDRDSYLFKDHSFLKIYVPAQSVNAYKTAQGWNQYANRIFPIQ